MPTKQTIDLKENLIINGFLYKKTPIKASLNSNTIK